MRKEAEKIFRLFEKRFFIVPVVRDLNYEKTVQDIERELRRITETKNRLLFGGDDGETK